MVRDWLEPTKVEELESSKGIVERLHSTHSVDATNRSDEPVSRMTSSVCGLRHNK